MSRYRARGQDGSSEGHGGRAGVPGQPLWGQKGTVTSRRKTRPSDHRHGCKTHTTEHGGTGRWGRVKSWERGKDVSQHSGGQQGPRRRWVGLSTVTVQEQGYTPLK